MARARKKYDIVSRIAVLLLLVGLLLIGWAITINVLTRHERERSVQAFDRAHALFSAQRLDPALESVKRTRAPQDASHARVLENLPEGVLRIPALHVRVPVYSSTLDLNLRRGAGRVEWTPRLGSGGNVGVAAHRDMAFAALQDIVEGDVIFVDRLEETLRYEVVRIHIVDPEDIHVLDPTHEPYLTLITCYPFNFVGPAPRRFVVHAKLSNAAVGLKKDSAPRAAESFTSFY